MNTIEANEFPIYARSLGRELLAYALNIDPTHMQALMISGGPFSVEHRAALNAIDAIVLQKKGNKSSQSLDWIDVKNLADVRYTNGLNPFNSFRSQLGGDCRVLPSDDPVKMALAKMCVDAYPASLLPLSGSFILRRFEIPNFFNTPILQEFNEALMADGDLAKLFGDVGDNPFANGLRYYTSMGNGSNVQMGLVQENLIRSGFALMHLKGEYSVADLQHATWKMVDILRSALGGRPTQVPHVAVFDLVGLPSSFNLQLREGQLSGIPEPFLKHIPQEATPATTASGDILGCLFIGECDYEISIPQDGLDHGTASDWPVNLSALFERNAREKISLATALAISEDRAAAARSRATITIDPLNGVGQSWMPHSITLGHPLYADDNQCLQISKFAKIIDEVDFPNIDLAARRFVSAVIHRLDQTDSLIDAVIGLENLFGNRSEISFSVATGVALLLSTDGKERMEIFKDVKKVYDARSAYVHGDKQRIAKIDLSSARTTAVGYLKRCLQVMFESRSDLIPLSASDRAKHLALLN